MNRDQVLSHSQTNCATHEEPEDRYSEVLGAEGGSHVFHVEDIQASCIDKAIDRTITAPLDRVKFVLQTQAELQRIGTLQRSFSGAWRCITHLASIEGPLSFWRGNLIQVASQLPITLAHIFIALPTQALVYNNLPGSFIGQTTSAYIALLCGALGASLVSYPLEFARFRLAVDVKPFSGATYEYRHSLSFFAHPVISRSPHFLYTGLGLYVSGSILYGTVHSGLLNFLVPRLPSESNGRGAIVVQVCAGFGVSAVSTLCLHPVDTVRRRMMVSVTEDDLRYPSWRGCLLNVLRTEGPLGLYRGASFTLLRLLVTAGIFTAGST
ncbi:putative Mitochondrial carrier protein [Trypanosoma vivax]|nr:putative Mitochondrial carrier protein [Trypanosoma vivax]